MGAGRGGHAYHGRYVRGFVPLGIPRMGAFGVTMARGTMGDCDSGLKVSPELVSTKPSSRSTPPLFEPSSFLRVKVTTGMSMEITLRGRLALVPSTMIKEQSAWEAPVIMFWRERFVKMLRICHLQHAAQLREEREPTPS